jgi:hypothetical protein
MTRREYMKQYHRAYGKLPKRRAYLTMKQKEYRANPMPKGLRRALPMMGFSGMVKQLCR